MISETLERFSFWLAMINFTESNAVGSSRCIWVLDACSSEAQADHWRVLCALAFYKRGLKLEILVFWKIHFLKVSSKNQDDKFIRVFGRINFVYTVVMDESGRLIYKIKKKTIVRSFVVIFDGEMNAGRWGVLPLSIVFCSSIYS